MLLMGIRKHRLLHLAIIMCSREHIILFGSSRRQRSIALAARGVSRSIPRADVSFKLLASLLRKNQFMDGLPLLQLVMMDSSVNSSQHSGSASMTLDCNRLVNIYLDLALMQRGSYHDWRQHCCCSSWFNRVLNCVVFVTFIRRARI